MCLQDVLIGRATKAGFSTVSITTAAKQIVSQSPNRFGLLVCAPVSGILTIAPDPAVTSGVGIQIAAGQGFYYLDIKTHGDLVKHTWFGIMSAGTVTVGFADVGLDMPRLELLMKGLEK
jgi:hypothetical protein